MERLMMANTKKNKIVHLWNKINVFELHFPLPVVAYDYFHCLNGP